MCDARQAKLSSASARARDSELLSARGSLVKVRPQAGSTLSAHPASSSALGSIDYNAVNMPHKPRKKARPAPTPIPAPRSAARARPQRAERLPNATPNFGPTHSLLLTRYSSIHPLSSLLLDPLDDDPRLEAFVDELLVGCLAGEEPVLSCRPDPERRTMREVSSNTRHDHMCELSLDR